MRVRGFPEQLYSAPHLQTSLQRERQRERGRGGKKVTSVQTLKKAPFISSTNLEAMHGWSLGLLTHQRACSKVTQRSSSWSKALMHSSLLPWPHTTHMTLKQHDSCASDTHLAHLSKKQKLRVKKLKVLAFLRGLLESSHWWRGPEETRTHLLEGQSLAEASSWRSLVAESRPRPSPLRGRI